jgi:hypothetical protein
VEEPHLRKHDGDGGERDRHGSTRGHDQRQQPDEVLRREDLGKREEAGDGSRKRDRQPFAHCLRARVEHPDRRHSERLENEEPGGHRACRGPRQVPPGHPRRLHDLGVVEAEPVEHEQKRGT